MRHEPVAIRFPDLVDRIGDGVMDVLDLLGITDKEIMRLLSRWDTGSAALNDRIDEQIEQRERDILAEMKDTWFRVTWPEHVKTPRFNGDATYAECRSKEEALADGAVEYGVR